MTNEQYDEFIKSNAKMGIDDIAYSVVGLAGETGEVAEWVKKVILRGDGYEGKLQEEDLKLELGDVLHYLRRIALVYGWTQEDLMEANVNKLQNRKGGWS